jgi:hypothetical protein
MDAGRHFTERITALASRISTSVLSITDWIGQQLHISSRFASRAGFLVLWGMGMTFIQVEEYGLAVVAWILSSVVLFSKSVHWPGFVNYPKTSALFRIFFVGAAVTFIPVSVIWTQSKRADKPWTSLMAPKPKGEGPYYPNLATNKNLAPKLIVTTESRFLFNDIKECGCTLMYVLATVSNVRYTPQASVHGWKLGVTLSDGRKQLAPPMPIPKNTILWHYDSDPRQPTYIVRGDENLIDRADDLIPMGGHQSGALFFLIHGINATDLAKNMVAADIFCSGPDLVVYQTHLLSDPNQQPTYYIPGLRSGIDWGDGAFK